MKKSSEVNKIFGDENVAKEKKNHQQKNSDIYKFIYIKFPFNFSIKDDEEVFSYRVCKRAGCPKENEEPKPTQTF